MDGRGPTDLHAGSAETEAMLAAVDWAATPLGPVEGWSTELRAAVRTVLPSEVPMLLWWGPELVQVYNAAFVSFLGAKHPALGATAAECWAEIWDEVSALAGPVLGGHGATYSVDQRFFLDRHLAQEETYWTFSYSPVHGPAGDVAGIFVATTETTARVVGDRRLRALWELGALSSAEAGGVEAALGRAMEVLDRKPGVHWAVAFLPDGDGLRPVASFGVDGDLAAVGRSDLVQRAWRSARRHEDPGAATLPPLDLAPTDVGETRAAVVVAVPLVATAGAEPSGVLLLGSSPHRVFDDEYRTFFDLVGRQVALLVSDAGAYRTQRDRADDLEAADRATTRFLQNVSHELRTPLTLVAGPLDEVLADDAVALPEGRREGLLAARRATLRLGRLVDGLLAVARGAEGALEPDPEPTDLATLTAAGAAMFRGAAESAGVTLEIDVEEGPPVLVDRDMWSALVTNLVGNALKATQEGSVRVTLRTQGGAAELVVADTGPGIPAEEQDAIFERFHQVPGTSHEGMGLGLSLVADVARAHGGGVEVESAPGSGATFRVRVVLPPAGEAPVRPVAAPEPAVVPAPVEPAPAEAGGRVLLVEDDVEMQAYLQRLLAEAGWEVAVAADVDAALATEAVPDVIVSDVMLPGRSGIDLVREVRRHGSWGIVPIILVTARAGPESAVDGLGAGADDYVVKPFAPAELVARVQVHMELSRLRAYALAQAEDEAANLRQALSTNREIGAAVGILMSRRGLTADDAFALLRKTSQDANRKLRAVAGDVVEQGELP